LNHTIEAEDAGATFDGVNVAEELIDERAVVWSLAEVKERAFGVLEEGLAPRRRRSRWTWCSPVGARSGELVEVVFFFGFVLVGSAKLFVVIFFD
jgi:hypothetical protein